MRAGGQLVLGQRSAMKDADNSLYTQRQPGPLAAMLGANVAQWYALDTPVPLSGEWGSGTDTIWAEQLSVQAPDAHVLMRYGTSNGWLDGQPAAVTRKVGKGSITYIGASLDGPTLKQASQWMLQQAGISAAMPGLPEGVDLAIRSGAGKRVVILTNYADQPRTVTLPRPMTDVLNAAQTSSVTLPRYGVAVLMERAAP